MASQDEEIARIGRKLIRYEVDLVNMDRWKPGDCCPACVNGQPYVALINQMERTRTWLYKLLIKRGTRADRQQAYRLIADGIEESMRKAYPIWLPI